MPPPVLTCWYGRTLRDQTRASASLTQTVGDCGRSSGMESFRSSENSVSLPHYAVLIPYDACCAVLVLYGAVCRMVLYGAVTDVQR
eukprot:2789243-Rhodomonas_salina.1